MKIANIVAVVKLSSPLDFYKIRQTLNDIDFTTSGSWLKYRLMPEGYYIAFYKSGKFLVTGVKSTYKLKEISKRVIKLLCEAGIEVKCEQLIIHNIVFTDNIRIDSTLEHLAYLLDYTKFSYEPEQFPGLIYKDWGASFLLFPNGKLVITGLKNQEDAIKVVENFKNTIHAIEFVP